MATSGFFLGGAAEGMKEAAELGLKRDTLAQELGLKMRALDIQERGAGLDERRLGQELDLRTRALNIQEKGQELENKRLTAAKIDAIFKENMESVATMITELKAVNTPIEGIAKQIAPLVPGLVSLAERSSGTPPAHTITRLQALLAAPTLAETSAAKGAGEAGKKTAESKGLAAAGVPEEAAAKAAGIEQPDVKLRTFRMPDSGEFKSVRANDPAAIKSMLDAGAVETPVTVQATSAGALTTGPNPKDVAKVREDIQHQRGSIEDMTKLLAEWEKNPESTGVLGKLIETGGGLIEQIPLGIGKEATGMLGIDTAKVQNIRTQMRVAVSSMLQQITQENSRFSDKERAMANETLKGLDAASSPDQVRSAWTTAIGISKTRLMRDVDRLRTAAGVDADALGTPAGIDKMGDILLKNGFQRSQAMEIVRELRRRHGLSGP
jgi:hypothetical protein